MKKHVVALAVFFAASNAYAVEFKDFDFNPMVGTSWASDTDAHYGMNASLTMGAELIYDERFLIGVTGAEASRPRNMYGAPDSKSKFESIYGGYFVSESLALKLGATFQTHDTTSTAWTPDGDQTITNTAKRTYAMLGAGYYYGDNFNISLHMNIPVSGDPFVHPYSGEELERTDFMMASLLVGYRF